MAKVKTSEKRQKSSRNIKTIRIRRNARVKEHSPSKKLADENFIGRVILDCLKDNDPEGVIEAIQAHLDAINKLKFSRDSEIPRSTLYYLSTRKNPTLRTLARTVHEISEFCYA